MDQDPNRTLNYDPEIDDVYDERSHEDLMRARAMVTDIDRNMFLRVCNREDGYFTRKFCLYTDWIVKLQEAGKPVEEWITSRLPLIGSFRINTIRAETQGKIPYNEWLKESFDPLSIVSRIRWPSWNPEDLSRIKYIEIIRHAITQLPPWIMTLPHLETLHIKEESPNYIKFEPRNNSPLLIPLEFAKFTQLDRLEILVNPFLLDSEFCRLNHIRHLDLDLTDIRSHLDDLRFFSHLKAVNLFSSHPLPSYDFLSTWTKVHNLTLRTKLDHMPDSMRYMQSLVDLNLEGNPLEDLPEWIVTLPKLRTITLNLHRGSQRDNKSILITEYPAVLRACPTLLYCDLGIPARSLYGLPPIARYWAAVAFTYPSSGSIQYDLPIGIRAAVREEFVPNFSYHYIPVEPYPTVADVQRWVEDYHFPYGAIDEYRQKGFYSPCMVCNKSIITGICPICGADNHLGPECHPRLVQFLEAYYAESYETLFNRVRNGEKLTNDERERFVHETPHQYYQLLCNTDQKKVDSTLLDELGQKFSVQLNDTTQILL